MLIVTFKTKYNTKGHESLFNYLLVINTGLLLRNLVLK